MSAEESGRRAAERCYYNIIWYAKPASPVGLNIVMYVYNIMDAARSGKVIIKINGMEYNIVTIIYIINTIKRVHVCVFACVLIIIIIIIRATATTGEGQTTTTTTKTA